MCETHVVKKLVPILLAIRQLAESDCKIADPEIARAMRELYAGKPAKISQYYSIL